MKPGRWLAGSLIAAVLAVPALSRTFPIYRSDTRAVAIDGKRFVRTPCPDDERSLAANPLFSESLRDAGETAAAPTVPLPAGLHAEHTLRMETASGLVTLAFGTADRSCRPLLQALRDAGWETPTCESLKDTPFPATIRRGKEMCVVFLDEKDRQFLFLRRVEE